jgi:hypothetical protein
MDRTLLLGVAALAVALLAFTGAFSVTFCMETRYRSSFGGTYEYQVSIAPGTTLGNVTLYLPVPARGGGMSEVIRGIGSGGLTGVPPGWGVSLIGTRKVTLLELTAGEVAPKADGSPTVISITTRVKGPIRTKNAGAEDLVLGTGEQPGPVACRETDTVAYPERQCRPSRGQAYADFTAPGPASLAINVSLAGRNSWDVFGPSSNEYRENLAFSFSGGDQGWHAGEGLLVTGIGDYRYESWPLEKASTPAPVERPDMVWWPLAIGWW